MLRREAVCCADASVCAVRYKVPARGDTFARLRLASSEAGQYHESSHGPSASALGNQQLVNAASGLLDSIAPHIKLTTAT